MVLMTSFIRYILITSGIILLWACKPQSGPPFMVDRSQGTFQVQKDGWVSGPFWVEVNGLNALLGGHLFRGTDSLVVISSTGGLDLLTVFKEAAGQSTIRIVVVNPGDSALAIRNLKIGPMAIPGQKANATLTCWHSKSPSEGAGPLWRWLPDSEQAPERSLNLSRSSIVLLPDERILLPPLQFFSHICSD